jgi:hypothetical protein
MYSLHTSEVHQSVCRLPGQFDAPESPDYCVYIMRFLTLQHLFFCHKSFAQ